MKRPWPLTGRDEELRRVAAAIRPGAAGIVVAGPAGVGKTRLAREALAVSGGRGVTVVWAHGSTAAQPLPLGAFAGLLDVLEGDAAETIDRALDQLARQRPLVLAVDDAHLLDEHSAIVLHRVVLRRLAPVLVTVRTGEPTPDTVTSCGRTTISRAWTWPRWTSPRPPVWSPGCSAVRSSRPPRTGCGP